MTDHDLPPAQARVRQSSETDGPDGMRQMKKALIGAITAALTSLAVSIPAIVKSCEAQNTAGEAKSTADAANIARLKRPANRFIWRSSGVESSLTALRRPLMRPTSVPLPVAVTTAVAWPVATSVPE